MESKKTVIFDFDGTLANSIDLIIALYNEHADEFGYEKLNRKEIPSLRRMGYKKAMKQKKIRYRSLPKMIPVLGREMRLRIQEVEPYEGIVSLLKDLQKDGYNLGVLTSNQAALVSEFFNTHDFPAFDFIVSEKTLFGKGKALKRIMRQQKIDSKNVVYVGDEPRDVLASRKAGVSVIGVTWGIGGKEGFEKTSPNMLVSSPRELNDAIHTIL